VVPEMEACFLYVQVIDSRRRGVSFLVCVGGCEVLLYNYSAFLGNFAGLGISKLGTQGWSHPGYRSMKEWWRQWRPMAIPFQQLFVKRFSLTSRTLTEDCSRCELGLNYWSGGGGRCSGDGPESAPGLERCSGSGEARAKYRRVLRGFQARVCDTKCSR
jgi:hypothetical protein